MRVLAVGAFDVPYIRDNWGDALRHVLGDDVASVNASAWLSCGPPESHMKAVYRHLATGRYDYLFLYHDYVFADFPDEFFAHVRSAGVKTIAYHPDDEPEVWYQRNRPFDERFDLVATHAKRGVDRRVAERRPTETLYLPWGFNPRFFDRPAVPVAPQYDVVFVGKYKVHEHDHALYREDGRQRDDTLQAVARLCEAHGWRFGLFGYGWERHPTLARFAGGLLSHASMIHTYHASKIVLNPAWSADETTLTPQTKLRHFEVPGCGAFQLTNTNADLAELLTPDRDVVFYDDVGELRDKVEYFLSDDSARQTIADSGYKRAHGEHTLDHRVQTLFSHARRLWPPKAADPSVASPPRVRICHARSLDEVRSLRESIAGDAAFLDNCDAVHVLAGDVTVTATHHAALRDWWRAGTAVFAGRCHYQASGTARNPLQPQRSEAAGGFLLERVSKGAIPPWADQLSERLPSISDGTHTYYLLNYIARPAAVPALLDAFLTNDPTSLDALQPLPTGLLFSEVQLPLTVGRTGEREQPKPPFLEPLRLVLRQAVALGHTVGIYGARGDMAETVFDVVRTTPDVRLVGLFDRAIAGRRIAGVPVYSSVELPVVAPNVLLIAAAYSGPAIYEQLKPLEPRMALVPVYDLKAPAWHALIPN